MAAKPARRHKPAAAFVPIDPTSPAIVLEYQGGRTKRYVPARALAGVDLGRIAYRRAADVERASRSALVKPGEQRAAPSRPGPSSQAELRDLVAELLASGAFTTADEITQPAPPAEQPEA